MTGTALLQIRDLSVSFRAGDSWLRVVHDLSLEIAHNEIVGLVGESGSGKSVTSLAIMGLLGNQGRIDSGRILFDGRCLNQLAQNEMLAIRGKEIAMIFQEPSTCLNPVFRIGNQVAEACRLHLALDHRQAMARSVELLERVGIPDPAHRARQYPHELSGGLKQRVMIAMALACEPKLLIADEPTTALDVTTQAQILDLIRILHEDLKTAVLLITHDLGIIAETAQRVVVMYAGEAVEEAPVTSLFAEPGHPYTRELLRCIPPLDHKPDKLPMIDGTMPGPGETFQGCRFAARCPQSITACRTQAPALQRHDERRVRCIRFPETATGSGVAND